MKSLFSNSIFSTCHLREEKSCSQRAFLILRIFASGGKRSKLYIRESFQTSLSAADAKRERRCRYTESLLFLSANGKLQNFAGNKRMCNSRTRTAKEYGACGNGVVYGGNVSKIACFFAANVILLVCILIHL